MPIPIPDYQQIEKPALPPAYVAPSLAGKQAAAQGKATAASAAIQRKSFEVSRRSIRQGMLTSIAKSVLSFAGDVNEFVSAERQRVKAASAAAELSRHAMESAQEFDLFEQQIEREEAPEAWGQQHLLAQGVPASDVSPAQNVYESWYSARFQEKFNEVLEKHAAAFSDPQAREKYLEYMYSYGAKAHGDFVIAGLHRDARLAYSDVMQSYQIAKARNDKPGMQAIMDSAIRAQVVDAKAGTEMLAKDLRGVDYQGALNDAAAFGEGGGAYLLGEDAANKYSLTREEQLVLAEKYTKDRAAAKSQEFLANRTRVDESWMKAAADIESGTLTRESQLDDESTYFLDASAKKQLGQLLEQKQRENNAELREYKDQYYGAVTDAINRGDRSGAQVLLNQLSGRKEFSEMGDKGRQERLQLAIDAMGKRPFTPFQARVSQEWAELENATKDDLDRFLKEGPGLEGGDFDRTKKEYDSLLDEWQQMQKDKKDGDLQNRLDRAAKQDTDQSWTTWWVGVNNSNDVDELRRARELIRGNIGPDPQTLQQRIKKTDAISWDSALDSRIRFLVEAQKKAQAADIQGGRDVVASYYKGEIGKLETERKNTTNKGRIEALTKQITAVAKEMDGKLAQYDAAAPGSEDRYALAEELLQGPKLQRVRDASGRSRMESLPEYYMRKNVQGLIPGTKPLPAGGIEALKSVEKSPEELQREAAQERLDGQILARFADYAVQEDGRLIPYSTYRGKEPPAGSVWIRNTKTGEAMAVLLSDLEQFNAASMRRRKK